MNALKGETPMLAPVRIAVCSVARRPLAALVALGLVGVLSTPALAQNRPFSLGLWGDMPYAKAGDQAKIPALIADMDASDIAFSLYDGDIKDGSSRCTDDVYEAAIQMFNQFRKPVVYIPGDNEWTDCHRINNGGYDNLERLAHLRKVMFDKPGTFGMETLSVERQGLPGEKFAENVRFLHHGVMFVGLNVPGSNNNRVLDDKDCTSKSARTAVQCEADNAEYAERDAANIAWMHDAFETARAQKAVGVMIVFQADPGFDLPETEDTDESRMPDHNGYFTFLDAIIRETKAFQGQVVLVHGDTHFFKIDKPLINATNTLTNLTRVQTFGSPNVHWIRVTVDPTSREVFTFHPMIVEANR
jgi:hypothetical protein